LGSLPTPSCRRIGGAEARSSALYRKNAQIVLPAFTSQITSVVIGVMQVSKTENFGMALVSPKPASEGMPPEWPDLGVDRRSL